MRYDLWGWEPTQHDRGESLLDVDRLFAAKGISRRDFLKISGIAVALAALPFGCGKAGGAQEEYVEKYVRLAMPPPPAGDIEVAIVKGGSIEEMVNRAIELAGGLGEIRSGDTVAIKPNLTTGYTLQTRVTTHPEVLRAVIRAAKVRTEARNITVVEASSYADPSTLEVAQKVGVYDVVVSEGVNFLAWEDEEYVEATISDFKHISWLLEIPLSLTDSRFDHFINVPMLKNHDAISNSNADYTCCIKNHVGVLSREMRTGGGGSGIHTKDLGEKIAELNLSVPVHTMNVVDALSVILSGGPASANMQYTDPGLILACKDRVACDSLGVAVLKHYAAQMGVKRPYVKKSVWEQAQIVRAQELNLGRYKENIRVVSDGVDNIDTILAAWD